MRAEGVSEHVNATVGQIRSSRGPQYQPLHRTLRQWSAVVGTEHPGSAKVPMIAEHVRQPGGQRDVPESSALRYRDVTLPVRALHAELPFTEVDI